MKTRHTGHVHLATVAALLGFGASQILAEDTYDPEPSTDVAMQLSNPVASLISLHFSLATLTETSNLPTS
jgi:hypothetical protein